MSAPQSPVIGRRNLTSIPALSSYPVLDVKSEDPPAFFAVQRGPTCGCSRGRRGPAGGGKALGSCQRPPSREHNDAHQGLEIWSSSRPVRHMNYILRIPAFGRRRFCHPGSALDQPQPRPDRLQEFRSLPDQLHPASGQLRGVPATGPVCHICQHFRDSGRPGSVLGGRRAASGFSWSPSTGTFT
jgi:hypothetical protein